MKGRCHWKDIISVALLIATGMAMFIIAHWIVNLINTVAIE